MARTSPVVANCELSDSDNRLQSRDNKIIAKPLPSRPAPPPPPPSFLAHHGLNHPHLHSLLAHCRNPYISGKFVIIVYIGKYVCT